MSYILKRDPAWLELLPGDRRGDPLADLVGDSGHVSVPATLLLAVSPLLRSMMTDILPPVYSPLVIILPGVRADVLQVVEELLLKGISDMNEDMKMMVRQVFEMLSIGASFCLQDKFVGKEGKDNVIVDDSECDHRDSKVLDIISIGTSFSLKHDIDWKVINEDVDSTEIKLEQDESKDFGFMNTEHEMESITVNLKEEERNFDNIWKNHGENKQPVADSDSFIDDNCLKSADNLESRVGQSKRREVIKDGESTDGQNMPKGNKHRKNKQADQLKVFKCQECEYQSQNKNNLTKHLRKHTGEKPFACCLCEFKTGDQSSLARHSRTHSGDKPFTCDICEYKAGDRSYLKKHQRIHSEDRPYSCDICEYKSRYKMDLQRHHRIHSGAKPLTCDKCEFKAGDWSYLKKHQRIHSGDK